MSVDDGAEDATRSADGAVADHHRLARHCVAHLMVVTDESHRECPRFAVDVDSYDEPVHLDLVSVGGHHHHRLRRDEHVVGGHLEVEDIDDRRRNHEQHRHSESLPTRNTPGVRSAGNDHPCENCAEQPAPRVQLVREVDAGHSLTARHRHYEVDVGHLEQNEEADTEVEKLFHDLLWRRKGRSLVPGMAPG